MARPRLLALGWDERRHEICERHDIEIVAVCSSSDWDYVNPDHTQPTRLLKVDDHRNFGGIVAELERAEIFNDSFSRVVTSDEFAVSVSGALATLMKTSGIAPDVAVVFRDKHLQNRRVASVGLPAAETAVIADIAVDGVPDSWDRWPAVVKPIAGGGAGSTARCESATEVEEFLAARHAAGARSFFGESERKFVIQEFLGGEEWFVNGCMQQGEMSAFSVGEYFVRPLDIRESGVVCTREFDSNGESWIYELAGPFARAALQGLGLADGLFHMEVFFDSESQRLVFGECAARVPGGLMPETIRLKTGIDIMEMEILHAVGREVPESSGDDPRQVGLTFLPARPGLLISAPTQDEIRDRPGVLYAGEVPPLGRELPEMSSNTTVNLTQAVMAADSRDELSRLMAELVAWADERTVVISRGATDRELRTLIATGEQRA